MPTIARKPRAPSMSLPGRPKGSYRSAQHEGTPVSLKADTHTKTQNTTQNSTHKGNKSSLPSKPCLACGRPMSWRKAWAKNWEQVRYCSDACRRNKGAAHATHG